MTHTITRQELYDRVWSKPLTQVAADFGTTNVVLKTICDRASIPTASSGYWMKKEFGKSVVQEPLGQAPPGYADPLEITPPSPAKPRRTSKTVPHTAESAISAVEDEPLVPGGGIPPEASAPATTPRRPVTATTLTREELYAEVWSTPMTRLALKYGLSGNGLAKICDRAGVPYPPRGYWARSPAAQAVRRSPLQEPGGRYRATVVIRPTPLPVPGPELPPEVARLAEIARATAASIKVPDRLLRPHPIIAGWIAAEEERRRAARRDRSPLGELTRPEPFTDTDRRQHRLLDTLFKALERQKVKITEGDRSGLLAETDGEKIEFLLREKHRQNRRPLTESEKRFRMPGDRDWRQELVPTGFLTFEIRTLLPGGLRSQWGESASEPLDAMLPEIVASFVAAGPLLVEQRKAREAAARERELEAQRRQQEQQRRKRDANRWRRFTELAGDWRQIEFAREFLSALRLAEPDPDTMVEDRSLQDWLSWAEDHLRSQDPLADGVAGVFSRIGQVREWSYRD